MWIHGPNSRGYVRVNKDHGGLPQTLHRDVLRGLISDHDGGDYRSAFVSPNVDTPGVAGGIMALHSAEGTPRPWHCVPMLRSGGPYRVLSVPRNTRMSPASRGPIHHG